MKRLSWHPRGVSLLEAMVTAAVLMLGIGTVASTVVAVSRLNRRNLAQAQAYTIAEWYLESITRIGCGPPATPSCPAIRNKDRTTDVVYWSASGAPTTKAPTAGDPELRRQYRVSVDVDPPFEGDEGGDPQLGRNVAGVVLSQTVNVRVTVSWSDDVSGTASHAVALQTRVSP